MSASSSKITASSVFASTAPSVAASIGAVAQVHWATWWPYEAQTPPTSAQSGARQPQLGLSRHGNGLATHVPHVGSAARSQPQGARQIESAGHVDAPHGIRSASDAMSLASAIIASSEGHRIDSEAQPAARVTSTVPAAKRTRHRPKGSTVDHRNTPRCRRSLPRRDDDRAHTRATRSVRPRDRSLREALLRSRARLTTAKRQRQWIMKRTLGQLLEPPPAMLMSAYSSCTVLVLQ